MLLGCAFRIHPSHNGYHGRGGVGRTFYGHETVSIEQPERRAVNTDTPL
jgi:hypothetical protein